MQGNQSWNQVPQNPNQMNQMNNRMVMPNNQNPNQRPMQGQQGIQQSFDFNRISEMPSKYPRE